MMNEECRCRGEKDKDFWSIFGSLDPYLEDIGLGEDADEVIEDPG